MICSPRLFIQMDFCMLLLINLYLRNIFFGPQKNINIKKHIYHILYLFLFNFSLSQMNIIEDIVKHHIHNSTLKQPNIDILRHLGKVYGKYLHIVDQNGLLWSKKTL